MENRFTRREVLKLAAAAAIAGPVGNRHLDQLMAVEKNDPKHPLRPWWVKEVDKPTTEID